MRALALCAAALLAALACTACGRRSAAQIEDPDHTADARSLAEARRMADDKAPLLPRADALALVGLVEAAAAHEGAGARAAQVYAVAARLAERVWRVEGSDADASKAIALYKSASLDPRLQGACESAVRAAHLAGDLVHDASVTYAELYRAERRFTAVAPPESELSASCRHGIEVELAELSAFRPAQRTLDAIDEALEGEGAVGMGPSEGGAARPTAPPRVVRVDSWAGRDAARVVVTLDRPAGYRAGDEATAGGASPQTFVDLDGVGLGAVAYDSPQSGVVTRVLAEATDTGSRVLLELEGRAWRRIFTMPEPFRIVIDVARNPPGTAWARGRELSRVVIDPGHGGRDNGAVGPTGVVEKDVTLDIAHRAASILVSQGLEVLLTRDDDRFVPLEERAARANAFSADLFVSIHCNASEGRGRHGVETYVLDATRDEIAARVAARENEMTQSASAELSAVLGNMRLADQSRRSTQFAHLLQRSAIAALRMTYRDFRDAGDGGVHFAGFYVLVGARMPSVLFESSYISNPVEEQRLATAEYRQTLADAIANAVKAYREGR
jgi:N-acetylmuramoyl-L-alanine amidase